MFRWIGLKPYFTADRQIDVAVRNVTLFNHPVSYQGGNLLMEKVRDPIMNAPRCGAKLVDSVRRKSASGRRSSWPSSRSRSILTRTLSLACRGNPVNQSTNGAEPILLAVNHDSRFRHLYPVYSQICESSTCSLTRNRPVNSHHPFPRF